MIENFNLPYLIRLIIWFHSVPGNQKVLPVPGHQILSSFPKLDHFIFKLKSVLHIKLSCLLKFSIWIQVRRFGAFAAVTVTSLRKAFSITLSFIIFSKPFTFQYLVKIPFNIPFRNWSQASRPSTWVTFRHILKNF